MKRIPEDRALFEYLVKRGEIAPSALPSIEARRTALFGPAEAEGLIAAAVDSGALDFEGFLRTYRTITAQTVHCPGCGIRFPRKQLVGVTKFRCKACKTVIEVTEKAPEVHVVDVAAAAAPEPVQPPTPAAAAAGEAIDALREALGVDEAATRWVVEKRRALERQGEDVPFESIVLAAGLAGERELAEAISRRLGKRTFVVEVDPAYRVRPGVSRRGSRRSQSRGVPKRTFVYRPPVSPAPVVAPAIPVAAAAPPVAPAATTSVVVASTGPVPARPASPQPAQIMIEQTAESTVVYFQEAGLVDVQRIEQIRKELFELVDEARGIVLVLDFESVEFLSSTMIGTLVALHKRVMESGGRLKLRGLSDRFVDIFEVTKLDKLFDLERRRPKAPAAPSPGPVAARSMGEEVTVLETKIAPPSPAPVPVPPSAEQVLAELLAGNSIDLSGRVVETPVSLANRKLTELNLRGTVFKRGLDASGCRIAEKVEARGAIFEGKADFKNADLAGGADFAECRFLAEASFNSAKFGHYATFREAEFGAPARFTRGYFPRGVKFDRVQFLDDASMNDIKVGHRFEVLASEFKGGLTLSGSTFDDLFHLKECKFENSVRALGAQFEDEVRIDSCRFGGELVFHQSSCEGDLKIVKSTMAGTVDFNEVRIDKSLHLRACEYESGALYVLSGAHIERLEAKRRDFEGRMRNHREGKFAEARMEYGFLKNCFREINEYDDEDWAYRMEKFSARKTIPLEFGQPIQALRRFFDWLALDRACGYGTKPFNVFLTAFTIIGAFAVVYGVFGGVRIDQAILYSFRAFAGAKIDTWNPGATDALNYVGAVESFLGIFVVTVLVVTFSRKVIR